MTSPFPFSLLNAHEVVKSDENFVNMTTFPFQWSNNKERDVMEFHPRGIGMCQMECRPVSRKHAEMSVECRRAAL